MAVELIDLAATPEGGEEFVAYLDKICQKTSMQYASYASASPVSGKVAAFTSYPDAWKNHYMEEKLHLSDPTLKNAVRSVAPLDWNRLAGTEEHTSFFSRARDFSIPEVGATIPIRGPYGETGLFSVTAAMSPEDWKKHKRAVIADLQLAAVYMHDRVMKSDSLISLLNYPVLSQRELEILQWVASGKTQQDIADILTISARTVEVHLRSSREKLSAISTPQAVGRAVSMGLITPR